MTKPSTPSRVSRPFVVLNPQAGGSQTDEVRAILSHHFHPDNGACRIHLTREGEDLATTVRQALADGQGGVDLVVAAGGDGTVSSVANGLVGLDSAPPLGILPLGTANVLARELGIPVELDAACHLLTGPHTTTQLDAMRVGDRVYFTQVGIGLDALMIRDTSRAHKRRFGRLAYLWTALTVLAGFQPRRFTIAVDDHPPRHPKASEVLIANGGVLGQPPFRWGPDIRPDDGRIDVCIIRARSALDYLRLGWHVLTTQQGRNPNVRYLHAERNVHVQADRRLPVQADGEIIGETPVHVEVVPAALRVVVPNEDDRP